MCARKSKAIKTNDKEQEPAQEAPKLWATAVDKAVAAVAVFAAQEDDRPVLGGVSIGKGKAVATDGFRLASVDLPKPVQAEDSGVGLYVLPGESVVLHRETVRTAGKPRKGAILVRVGGQVLALDAGSGNVIGGSVPIDGTFPDVEKVIPAIPKQPTAALNARYLRDVGAFFMAAGADNEVVRIHIEDPHKGVLFWSEIPGEKRVIRAVLMPMMIGPGIDWELSAEEKENVRARVAVEEEEKRALEAAFGAVPECLAKAVEAGDEQAAILSQPLGETEVAADGD